MDVVDVVDFFDHHTKIRISFVLLIGTNNLSVGMTPFDTARGIRTVAQSLSENSGRRDRMTNKPTTRQRRPETTTCEYYFCTSCPAATTKDSKTFVPPSVGMMIIIMMMIRIIARIPAFFHHLQSALI